MKSKISACLLVVFAGTVLLAQSAPVPLVNQPLIPSAAKAGSAGFSLKVDGAGFAPGAVLRWNGSSRLTEVVSSTRLKAKITSADVAQKGTALVTVVNPGGATSNLVYFPVRKPSAAIAMAGKQVFSPCYSVAVGDFNNDGILDVVWAGGGTLNLSFGDGKGGFLPPITSNIGLTPTQMVAGDFNGDGKLDLAAGYYRVFLQGDNGTFTQSWASQAPGGNNRLAVADFNQDGKLDLYGTGWDLGRQWFAIYLGLGEGKFAGPNEYLNSFFSGSPGVGDYNSDGQIDLAVPGFGDVGGGGLFLGDGQGGFTRGGSQVPAALFAVAADMNHDRKLDLVNDQGCIVLGHGDGTFSGGGCMGKGGVPLGAADFSGDGNLDAAFLTSFYPLTLAIQLGDGKGTFQSSFEVPIGGGDGNPLAGAIGDFNNDGRLDVILDNGVLLLQTNLSLLPTSLAFADQDVGTSSQPQTATLTNAGTSALAITSIRTGSQDFAETNNCGSSLPAGQRCQIQVTFTPVHEGQRLASLKVKYKGAGSPLLVALSGNGIGAPTVSLTPSQLSFPVQLIDTESTPQIATLTNTGAKDVSISGIAAGKPFIQTNNCPPTLSAGSSCQISVTFKPHVGGDVHRTLAVTDNAPDSPQEASLSGTGTVVNFSVSGVNFGDQQVGTKSAPAPVTLTNLGSQALNVSEIAITGTNAGDFAQTNDCGNSIPAHGQCKIKITFTPQAKGARSAALSVSDDGGGSPQTLPLSGTGT